MKKPVGYVVLAAGIASPFVSAYVGPMVYADLTRASTSRDADFVYRLSMVILAMSAPFIVTLALALWTRRGAWTWPEKTGLAVATVSLVFAGVPLSGLVERWQQSRNLAVQDSTAPPFDTLDLTGRRQRLEDHAGKVVLVNIWATWCYPCRTEMPKLDQLYRKRQADGLVVFGFSPEDVGLQRAFVSEVVQVSYPLLTPNGQVPGLFRNIARYPAMFLIDRRGNLQPAPGPDRPFSEVEAAVDALLAE